LQEGRTIQGEDFAAMWMPISKLGATYENANGRLIAVDIPPDRDIQSIYSQFETGKAMGVWVFEEANCQSHAPWRRNGACGPCLNRH
jgi:hypothetical protein